MLAAGLPLRAVAITAPSDYDTHANQVERLIGTQAAGWMIGELPGLDALDEDGNPRATSDFRGI
jgi:hypothetical protein